ncbi:MAG: metallophosphoesterase [Candidatus Omnitrophica bacterium]|nr:metallophosphoesterase [Candidatus Omnitrophota bacterium]
MIALTGLSFVAEVAGIDASEHWRFIVLADWHSAEKYTQLRHSPDSIQDAVSQDINNIKMLKKNYGGELILLPGDVCWGIWHSELFINDYDPNLRPEQSVLEAGHYCYTGMIDSFKRGGYDKLLMAVGDHELGDNPWPRDSLVANLQPKFRQVFSEAFNFNPDNGKFLYDYKVGLADPRPLGTRYENTSYAYKYKNALFVTLDVFEFDGPDKKLNDSGEAVTGAVRGKHLKWLDKLLEEAGKDPLIKHVFVQGHLPVFYPVRMVMTSGLSMDNGVDSEFWKILRKHKVDVYFAGEVHANTATKDSESDLVHLVSRGNHFDNFLTVDVFDNKIGITCYNHIGQEPADGKYEVSGHLVIDKSGSKTTFMDEGELAFIDTSKPVCYFNFEKDYSLEDRQLIVLKRNAHPKRYEIDIGGVKCFRSFENLGVFGKQYDAIYNDVKIVNGINGKAGRFISGSRMAIWALGPHYDKHALSYSLWFKTSSVDNQVLINSASSFQRFLRKFFNLNLNNGEPQVMAAKDKSLTAEGVKLNDGKWHHIAVSMPYDGCKLSQVQIYADGDILKTRLSGEDEVLSFPRYVQLHIGCMGFSHDEFDILGLKPFIEEMDEIGIWAVSLTAGKIADLVKRGPTVENFLKPYIIRKERCKYEKDQEN